MTVVRFPGGLPGKILDFFNLIHKNVAFTLLERKSQKA
jgi:hypothetical protein